MIFTA